MTDPTGSLQVATPERVTVDLPLAGLGSRAMAYLVDVALLGAVTLVVYFLVTLLIPDPVNAVLGLSSLVRTISAAVLFFGLWIFWTAFEVAWNGQSPGKRLVRIRVVQADGSPTTVFASAVRNLLRIVDFLPVCYPVGVISMLIDRKHRRLGDLLAGTVLVRDEKVDLQAYESMQATQVEVNLLELSAQFLKRFDSLEPEARLRIARKLAAKLELTVDPAASGEALRELIKTKVGAS